MAAAFLRAELARRGSALDVGSAGLVSEGIAPPPAVLEAMDAAGFDLSGHRSRLVSAELLDRAALIVAMAQRQVAELTVISPRARPRMFTAGEVLRLARAGGARREECLARWAERLTAGRPITLDGPDEDVPDPMGAGRKATDKVRDRLSSWAAELAPLLT